jgi:hypothetical protein
LIARFSGCSNTPLINAATFVFLVLGSSGILPVAEALSTDACGTEIAFGC